VIQGGHVTGGGHRSRSAVGLPILHISVSRHLVELRGTCPQLHLAGALHPLTADDDSSVR